jgi:hypothetical protein
VPSDQREEKRSKSLKVGRSKSRRCGEREVDAEMLREAGIRETLEQRVEEG